MSIDKAVHDVVNEISAAHPTRTIKLDARGGKHGEWDCARISQVLANLIGNAVEHGDPGGVISVTVTGDDAEALSLCTTVDLPSVRTRSMESSAQ